MQQLTDHANQAVQNLAQRYNVSVDAVKTLLQAVSAGGGTMAQFYHSELGGGGQWMRGGMTMVGDMFNSGLQATVSGLCGELSNLLASGSVFVPAPLSQGGNFAGSSFSGSNWWPSDLGSPSSSGGQNDSRYAVFPGSQRLAIDRGGQVTVYDTLDHQIGGVQQQQSGPGGSLSFSSQRGTFTVDSLPVVSGGGGQSFVNANTGSYQGGSSQGSFYQADAPSGSFQAAAPSGDAPRGQSDILAAIDRLGDLHHRGILSDEEFRSKKAELLSRL
jgi:hypothetical protein